MIRGFLLSGGILLSAFLTINPQLSAQIRKDTGDYTKSITPKWVEGTTWTEIVSYRKLTLGKGGRKADEDSRSESSSLMWEYKVTRTKEKPDTTTMFRVQARNVEKLSREIAAFTFASQPAPGDTPHRLSLLRGRFFKYFRGIGEKDLVSVSSLRQHPKPVLTANSSIIYDFPVFPVNVRDKATLDKDDRGERELIRKKVYMVTADTGDGTNRYAMDIVQKEYRNPSPDTFLWKGATKELKDMGFPVTNLVGVQLHRPFDNQVVRQLWHRDFPWPLQSIGPWYRTRLLSHGMAAERPEKSGSENSSSSNSKNYKSQGEIKKITPTGTFDGVWSSGTDSFASPYSTVGQSPASPPNLPEKQQ